MSSPILLFHFPQLVSIQIINSMDPAEQFLISLCSRRAHAYMKKFRNSKHILALSKFESWHVSVSDEQGIDYRSMEIESQPTRKNQIIDSSHENRIRFEIVNYDDCDCLITYWEDPRVGMQIFLEFLIDLFPIDVNTLYIFRPSCIWTLEWFQNHQKPPKRINADFSQTKFKAEDLDYVLLNCEAEILNIKACPSFPYEIKNFHRKFGSFSANGGNWVTISNLMTLDCIEIDVNKQFTNSEVNLSLKNWLSGGTPNLKYLVIGVKNYNMDETFAGIRSHLIWVPGSRVYTSPYESKFTFDGLQLRRNDNVIASIQCSGGKIHLGIWPDEAGSN